MSLKRKVEKLPGYNTLVLPMHWMRAKRAVARYRQPAEHLRVIAVTGTNGKTTTCFMIWKMLTEIGYKTGLLTTVGWSEDGETIHRQYEHMTTERVDVLNQRMRAVADAGSEFMVLEVTSHALAQSRTLGVPIEIAVFTNLTHEHLDYHRTFANYRKAKMKLFRHAKYGVINADDPSAPYFIKMFTPNRVTTYGTQRGDIRATNVQLNSFGVDYTCVDSSKARMKSAQMPVSAGASRSRGPKGLPSKVNTAKDTMTIETQIPGKFNVYNSLAAVAVGKRLGFSDEQIENGIHALESVEGRMNRIDEGQDFGVIVDYAHTPDALEKVFESIKKVEGRVIAVHGGAGRRDESTRSIRGKILGKNSDIVVITEDDSRDEDPRKIAEQFVEGAEQAGKVMGENLFVELDRKEAIRRAIKMAKPGDMVLVLGKGHEKTILRVDGPHKFEDVKVVTEILRGRK